ncbi:nucleotide sugar dehydrogenase [Gulosibacter chungangensis]|uniref:nucleotide sugar dehydrogenase n=1 Tax=Gulosibacter chungangensis TaxID=979746 RepID=UPI001CE42900|nr:nucleotide sugar dehydrogenase [Gulosibacter chungangensis]
MQNVVIVGQGYVGLPLAAGAVKGGFKVYGLDLNDKKVATLNSGKTVIDDISSEEISRMIECGYEATSDSSVYGNADVIVICVPTPLGEAKAPDLKYVKDAVASIGQHVKAGTLIILESTTYPGTTGTLVAPILEAAGFQIGKDIFLAFSPERIDPGNTTYGLANTPKVVGADDPESRRLAQQFYSKIVDEVVLVSGTAEAELTKLLENTYRHVNIALVNELAMVCKELDIDIWEVIRAAATKPFGFQAFYPGPGVGGHCIPIDPNYLSYRVKDSLDRPFRFVELAEEINSSMPAYVVTRVQEVLNGQRKALNGSKVLLLGVTYKSGISDTRQSPAVPIAQKLTQNKAVVSFYDPFIEEWEFEPSRVIARLSDLNAAVKEADIVVLLQNHHELDLEKISSDSKSFLDTRGAVGGERIERL